MGPDTESNAATEEAGKDADESAARPANPSPQQTKWLARGLEQPGGKLPLFDDLGQRVSERTVQSCIRNGWAEPWFANPLKPDWQVCKLTDRGRGLFDGDNAATAENPGATVHHLHS